MMEPRYKSRGGKFITHTHRTFHEEEQLLIDRKGKKNTKYKAVAY